MCGHRAQFATGPTETLQRGQAARLRGGCIGSQILRSVEETCRQVRKHFESRLPTSNFFTIKALRTRDKRTQPSLGFVPAQMKFESDAFFRLCKKSLGFFKIPALFQSIFSNNTLQSNNRKWAQNMTSESIGLHLRILLRMTEVTNRHIIMKIKHLLFLRAAVLLHCVSRPIPMVCR